MRTWTIVLMMAMLCLTRAIPHTRQHAPEAAAAGWKDVERAGGETVVEVTLALKLEERGIVELRRHFLACSDPAAQLYGKHWGRDTLARTVTTQKMAENAALFWLKQHGLRVLPDAQFPGGRGSGFVRARGAASLVEKAFGVELRSYRRGGDMIVRGMSELAKLCSSIPYSVCILILFVFLDAFFIF